MILQIVSAQRPWRNSEFVFFGVLDWPADGLSPESAKRSKVCLCSKPPHKSVWEQLPDVQLEGVVGPESFRYPFMRLRRILNSN